MVHRNDLCLFFGVRMMRFTPFRARENNWFNWGRVVEKTMLVRLSPLNRDDSRLPSITMDRAFGI